MMKSKELNSSNVHLKYQKIWRLTENGSFHPLNCDTAFEGLTRAPQGRRNVWKFAKTRMEPGFLEKKKSAGCLLKTMWLLKKLNIVNWREMKWKQVNIPSMIIQRPKVLCRIDMKAILVTPKRSVKLRMNLWGHRFYKIAFCPEYFYSFFGAFWNLYGASWGLPYSWYYLLSPKEAPNIF